VDIGRILSFPWNGPGAFAYMDILSCSGDFIWQPESDRSYLDRPKSVADMLSVVPIPNARGNVDSLETLSAAVGQELT
jgi:hypothetical protein